MELTERLPDRSGTLRSAVIDIVLGTLYSDVQRNKFAILPVGQEELASAAGAWAVMGDSSSDEDERPAARAAPTSFLSGPELLPSLIIDESEAAPVRRIARDWGLE